MTIRNQIADIDAEIDKVNEETRPLRMKIYSADDQIRELERRKTDLIAQHADDGGGYFQMMLDGDMPLAEDQVVKGEISHLANNGLTNSDSIYVRGDLFFRLLCDSESPARLVAMKTLNEDLGVPRVDRVKELVRDNQRRIQLASPDECESICDSIQSDRRRKVEALASNIPGSVPLDGFLEAARLLHGEGRVRFISDDLSRYPLAVDTLDEYRNQDESEVVELFRQAWGRGRPPEDFYLNLGAGRIIQFLHYASRYDWTKADRLPVIQDAFREIYRVPTIMEYPCRDGERSQSIGAGLSSNPKKRRQQEDLIEHFGNRCHVCSSPHWAYVDHDHASDLVRGLACKGCNVDLAKCSHPGVGEHPWSVDCSLGGYMDSPPAFDIDMRDPFYGGGRAALKKYQDRMPFMRVMAKSDSRLDYILPMLDKLESGELLTAEETLYSPGGHSSVTLNR